MGKAQKIDVENSTLSLSHSLAFIPCLSHPQERKGNFSIVRIIPVLRDCDDADMRVLLPRMPMARDTADELGILPRRSGHCQGDRDTAKGIVLPRRSRRGGE